MNDGTISINFGMLEQAGIDIQNALAKLDSQLDQLEQSAEKLQSVWGGKAQEAYGVQRVRWRAAQVDLQTILRDIQKAVQESAVDYRSTENRAINMFQ